MALHRRARHRVDRTFANGVRSQALARCNACSACVTSSLRTCRVCRLTAVTALAAQMLEHIEQPERTQSRSNSSKSCSQRKDRDIAYRDAKIEKITFELTRLKRWKFGAKSEAMTAEQRQLFQDTLLEDEADLEAQLAALQAALPKTPAKPKAPASSPAPPGAARSPAPRRAPPRARGHDLHDSATAVSR